MNAEIITIGDELLIGQVVDTNSAWLCEHLNMYGVRVQRITTTPDDLHSIIAALSEAKGRARVVFVTGGLGPTKDDITKAAACEFFNCAMRIDAAVMQHITELLTARGIPVSPTNRSQAIVPARCIALHNNEGMAPAMYFDAADTAYIFMPGVPYEMQGLMQNEILPLLCRKKLVQAIVHKTVMTYGIPESTMSDRLEKWELALPAHIKLAYLPGPIALRLRLSAHGPNYDVLKHDIDTQIERLKSLIPDNIFGFDDETMAAAIGKNLVAHSQTVSVAESCTGGYIAHLFTSNPGSSAYFQGSITAYANQVKMDLLGVKSLTMMEHGAVSRKVAEEMAEGARRVMNTDYAIATTGIAGPDGGSPDKPVGTVWIAVATPLLTVAKRFVFGVNRERNILRASMTALNMLRKLADNS
ncbi:MAG: CinA family nicotinamide mononucleotide deamidase-related protein [Bacteroidales bacterium]|jgi:nicotinamide-nucleotide amidase|nr:CinA family nicotinamide mononucleotide deamidase-related protein [Bacteroidales bacterium]